MLLKQVSGGQPQAFESLLPLVYNELHALARRQRKGEAEGHGLQTTALVHEAYLKLIDQSRVEWQDRAHFYSVAALAIRRTLVDEARRRQAVKRGGAGQQVPLEQVFELPGAPGADLVALDDALEQLARNDPRKSRVIELRFFGGLSIPETAAVLDISHATVERDWSLARAWLHRELSA